jgi:hypothetical protein
MTDDRLCPPARWRCQRKRESGVYGSRRGSRGFQGTGYPLRHRAEIVGWLMRSGR